jgi:hypothetical protein
MTPRELRAPVRGLLSVVVGVGLLLVGGCAGQDEAASPREPVSKSARARKIPRLASAPTSARLMQVYFNTSNGREWIYDGARWTPHDQTVDDFYKGLERASERRQLGAEASSALTVPFSPNGAHARHGAYDCVSCHLVGGSPCLSAALPGSDPGRPPPTFDATAKTCSSVACHGAYSGNFTYSYWDWGIDDSVTVTVPYSGSGGAAPSWYSTGTTCSSCHGNPPAPVGNWHSPTHASTMPTGRNCEICHPDATSAVVGGRTVGVSIKAASAILHANGVANVQAKFTSKCFGCH